MQGVLDAFTHTFLPFSLSRGRLHTRQREVVLVTDFWFRHLRAGVTLAPEVAACVYFFQRVWDREIVASSAVTYLTAWCSQWEIVSGQPTGSVSGSPVVRSTLASLREMYGTAPRQRVPVASEAHLDAILEMVEVPPRVKATLTRMYYCGLRPGEPQRSVLGGTMSSIGGALRLGRTKVERSGLGGYRPAFPAAARHEFWLKAADTLPAASYRDVYSASRLVGLRGNSWRASVATRTAAVSRDRANPYGSAATALGQRTTRSTPRYVLGPPGAFAQWGTDGQ